MGRRNVLIAILAASVAITASADGKTAAPVVVGRRKPIKHKPLKVAKAPVVVSKKVAVPQPTVVITPKCPDGYDFRGKECVSKHEVPETYACPGGTEEYQGLCHKRFHGKLVCHDGYHLKDKECVGEEYAPVVLQCPDGSVQHGQQCVVALQHAPSCPPGTARVGSQCARFSPMVKECPVGYAVRGDLCATQVYEDPDSVCPTGSIPDGHVCKVITTEEEICPPGTVDVGDHCAKYKNRMKECPKGFSMSGKECIRSERAPKIAICANGGNPDDGCIVTIPVPPSPYCKIGKICSTGQCAKIKRFQPSWSCPNGYHLEHGKRCVKKTTYDCTATHEDIECVGAPQPTVVHEALGSSKGGYSGGYVGGYSPNNPHVRHRMLGVDAKGKNKNIHYSKLAPVPKCQKKAPATPKTCEKVHTADGEAFCDQGLFKGTHCEMQEYFAPEYRCDAKTDGHGNCFVEERTPLLYTCPAGYTKSGDGCTRTIIEAPHFYCPPGSVEPNCAVYADKVCPGGNCVNKHIESPKLVCPEGYHMLDGEHTFQHTKKIGYKYGSHSSPTQHDGPKCTKTMYADKLSGCPRGTVEFEGLKCASFVDFVVQKSDKRVEIQKLCPHGYAAASGKSDKCVKHSSFPAEVSCPSGAVTNGYSCLEQVSQIASCPQGAVGDKGRCWAVSTVTPIMVKDACGYDVGKSSCRNHYGKARAPVPTTVKTGKSFKKTKHYGGVVHSQPAVQSKGVPVSKGAPVVVGGKKGKKNK